MIVVQRKTRIRLFLHHGADRQIALRHIAAAIFTETALETSNQAVVNLYHIFCSGLILIAIAYVHIVVVKLDTRKNMINSDPSIPCFIRQSENYAILQQFI